MGFNCGIIGLPNVGKSTLFNALTRTMSAQAANYPFCTIEPNVGRVAVPDERIDRLAILANSVKTVPTQLEFVDIAGLVRGASKGEGLGNQFLGHIRQVDALVHVLRCFEGEVTHVEGSVDPLRDAATVETELMLADLDSLERRTDATVKKARAGDMESKAIAPVMEQALALLREGKPVRRLRTELSHEDAARLQTLQLLTAKPVLYACNVGESEAATGNALAAKVAAMAKSEGGAAVIISAAIESEIAQLAPEEQKDFLDTLSLDEPGLNRVIRAGYTLLDLITFFTVGPKETRAWTIPHGAKAPQAAGAIHTDFERGFIRAETIAYDDYVRLGGESACREAGKVRQEGKEYLVVDGDIMHFKFNV
ncbi:MAG: redox-regulated ATPase YchF [Alphaproteobacteria bacterium]|nr:MAG: redox-regulated ATPase YchF [Alphaproteobacteria bacterium]